MGAMRVWIDQDLCTGDGLCTDHCPEVFVLLEDGISYVRDVSSKSVAHDPGGRPSMVPVPHKLETDVVAAALDCPGECIFLEDGAAEGGLPDGDVEMSGSACREQPLRP